MDGKTAVGASSPTKPALTMPLLLSTTSAGTSADMFPSRCVWFLISTMQQNEPKGVPNGGLPQR